MRGRGPPASANQNVRVPGKEGTGDVVGKRNSKVTTRREWPENSL